MKETRYSKAVSPWSSFTSSFQYESVSDPSDKNSSQVELVECRSLVKEAKAPSPQGFNPDEDVDSSQADTLSDSHRLEGRPWRVGIGARFPVISFVCLLVILGSMTGLIIVLLVSDGKNTETWDSRTVNIANHHRKWTVSVSTWIAVLNFIMGKALAVMFAEAVALSWWVDALKGQTLERLHFQWEVGQSVSKILLKWRFWGWVCVASIAFTAFSGLEALLQTASSPATSLSSYNTSMTATLPNALPAGFSGVIASWGHDSFATEYYTPIFVQVLQNYTVQSPIHLDLDGCPSTPNAWCAIHIPGVGFQYTCTAGRNGTDFENISSAHPVGPESTLFQVDFQQGAWSVLLRASWKDVPGSTGPVIANRNCTLTCASRISRQRNAADGDTGISHIHRNLDVQLH